MTQISGIPTRALLESLQDRLNKLVTRNSFEYVRAKFAAMLPEPVRVGQTLIWPAHAVELFALAYGRIRVRKGGAPR